jgi:4-hydroxythreonine-4-phosphate dehydrogenase
VAGLNPHCGEKGLFGREEALTIRPAIRKLQVVYGGITGPIPGDTLLHDAYAGKYDAVVCMYHDQGLAAFKMVARDEGVNLTLGLPFVRTSPDHGTGFDIAGKGRADPGSMREAIKLAVRLAKRA